MNVVYFDPAYSKFVDQMVVQGFTRTEKTEESYKKSKDKIQKIMAVEKYVSKCFKGITINDFPYDTEYKQYTYCGGNDESIQNTILVELGIKAIIIFRNTNTKPVKLPHYQILVEPKVFRNFNKKHGLKKQNLKNQMKQPQ